MNKPLITVFTPTFNRKKLLTTLYQSLCRQINHDFIWLIIDDGSQDGTDEMVKEWQKENIIQIQYFYKENGGMHTAHNIAYRLIETELNVCIDSDDSMPPDAIEKITKFWNGFERKNEVAGIMALDFDINKKHIIGGELPETGTVISCQDIVKKHQSYGDKKFVYKTETINSVSEYPEFEGEKIVPLSYKYWLVDRKLPIVTFNEIICLVNYQENGSTNTIKRQYFKSPKGFLVAKKEQMIYPKIFKSQAKSAIHYVFFSLLSGEKNYIKNSPKKLLTLLAAPAGFLYYKKMIKRKTDL
ncbi:MAG: glycosyltransferase family 2 protein [Clostridia bacterium]|nr:glycosyltransferase family 2 protein [Clostridia bacterium]